MERPQAGFAGCGVTAMRTRYLTASLLTMGICFSQAPNKKAVGCIGCFSEPQTTLLFRGACDDLRLVTVTPSGSTTVPEPPEWIGQCASPIPAISPSGDRIAWSLKFRYDTETVKCDPSKEVWCDPHPRPIFRSVMGVYSVRDKTWKQYGNFEEVGSAAFSPDGSKVAFFSQKGCTLVHCDDALMILDLESGQMTPVPGPGYKSVFWVDQLSWSPDGRFLSGSVNSPRFGRVVSINVATGETKTITEGTDPSWSPKGDWIAYIEFDDCKIIHSDGTGDRSVFENQHKWTNTWSIDAPIVWSPDGEKLLLNQAKPDAAGSRVIMVDLATGHAVRISKNPEVVVSGWVPYSGK